ncbi:MAG: mevalonate kinase [Candidatus Bathyarchaeota archaeon]
MTTQGYGFGKVILFNEHFVVYGVPAIASAIELKTIAFAEPLGMGGISLSDEREAGKGYKEGKLEQQKESLQRIIKVAKIDPSKKPVKLILKGDLRAESGIGASAASCVAIARALSKYLDLGLSNEKINEISYEGEKGYHGTPSGIDNTAATYGGLIWFEKGNPNVIDRIKLRNPVEIVLGNTGIVADTKAVVSGVKERKEKYPEKYDAIFEDAKRLVHDARDALEKFDLKKVGLLMNENHRLLQKIEVSSSKLDFLVNLAIEQGAFGAKMTGGGLGGNMVALTPGKEIQEKVAKAITREGFEVSKTRIGVE